MTDETRWTLSWTERSVEEARIFNPAFCSELIARTVGEYYRACQTPLNLVIVFLVLPLTLHRPTCEALPRRSDVVFAGWVADNASILVELPVRATHLRPVSREALLFALNHQLLVLDSEGFVPGSKPVRATVQFTASTDEVNTARNAAGLLGRWFARQIRQTSILQGLGVAP